jgi:hypothetical protein
VDHLGAIDIHLLEDLSFYFGPDSKKKTSHLLWSNILGVLMTGILLTFGAPFWYEKLRTMQVLQNRLGDVVKNEAPKLEDRPTNGAPANGEPKTDITPSKQEAEAKTPPGKASSPS